MPGSRLLRNLAVIGCALASRASWAHSEHAQQPPGVIDPLLTHHAVLEDEFKLNYSGLRARDDASLHMVSLELAYAFTDLLGAEVFLPVGLSNRAGLVRGGLGDLEVQIPKVSFLRRPRLVMTTHTAIRAPTGDHLDGLGERGWTLAPHLLVDLGLGRWGIQANAATEWSTEGEIALEGRLSAAGSFFGKEGAVRISPLAELGVEQPLGGEGEGPELVLAPGFKLGLGRWHAGSALVLPITGDTNQRELLVQVGRHVDWAGGPL